MVVIFFVPVSLLLLIPAIAIWGFSIVPLLICGNILSLLTYLWGIKLGGANLPFSLPREMQNKSGKVIRVLGAFLLMGVVIGVVYLLSLLSSWVALVVCCVAPLFIVVLFRVLRKLPLV